MNCRNVIVVGKLGGFLFLMPVMLVHDVDAEMRLHAEIPLIALLGLMHLRIARLGRILG
jgi:hypothetical protein